MKTDDHHVINCWYWWLVNADMKTKDQQNVYKLLILTTLLYIRLSSKKCPDNVIYIYYFITLFIAIKKDWGWNCEKYHDRFSGRNSIKLHVCLWHDHVVTFCKHCWGCKTTWQIQQQNTFVTWSCCYFLQTLLTKDIK